MSTESPLGIAGITLFELFKSLVEAGFTEDQALRLLAYNLAASNATEDDDNGT